MNFTMYMNMIYSIWCIKLIMLNSLKNACGFLRNDVLLRHHNYIKSSVQDYQYEYQTDWISGEVPWEFIDLDNVLYNNNNNNNNNIPTKIDSSTYYDSVNTMDSTIMNVEYSNGYSNGYSITINTEVEKNIIVKAIVSGVMKGIYVQIVSIDNMITYTQCYTNKVIDMDILLSLLYYILYEKTKLAEIENIIILKKYNNIKLFEKYIKLRRNSMIVIIILYVLLFRGISNVE